jgi:hypothetical protein
MTDVTVSCDTLEEEDSKESDKGEGQLKLSISVFALIIVSLHVSCT